MILVNICILQYTQKLYVTWLSHDASRNRSRKMADGNDHSKKIIRNDVKRTGQASKYSEMFEIYKYVSSFTKILFKQEIIIIFLPLRRI